MAKTSTRKPARATRKSSTAKAKASTKKSTASAKKRATAKKGATTRAKAGAKKRTTTKAKATTRKSATAKKRTTTKAKATTRKSATAKKRTTTKAAAKKRTATRAKATAKKRTTTRAKATAKKRTTTKAKSEFDFNSWLLPTLDIEQYEPEVAQETGVEDNIKGSTRYAWIGAGQCGGRLVKSFYDLGYKKAIAVNTANHDLELLDLPEDQKFLMDIGEKGAGKEMDRGRDAVHQHQQEIFHLAMQKFGNNVDHVMICFGAGGGTGSGSATELIEVAKKYARYIGLTNPNKNVGVIMTLPTVGEASSPLVAENAYTVANELSNMASAGEISPLIIVDNEKVHKMYKGMTVKSFWPSINNSVASLFDIFNRLSNLNSDYTSYDPVDHNSIMEAGGCAIMGLTKVTQFNDRFAISEAVKKNLGKTLLAGGFDLASAKLAGCIVVGGKKLMANAQGLQGNVDYAFDVLSEITGNASIHRGIYEDDRESLRVYTIIGGLDKPTARLEELKSHMLVSSKR